MAAGTRVDRDADWTQGDGSLQDRLTLADWRRRVATLYSEVRAMAASDPAVALAHCRTVREWLFREHPQSPLPVAARATFRANHFDHDPRLRFVVPVELVPAVDPGSLAVELPNSGTDTLSFRPIGLVRLPFPAGERRLSVRDWPGALLGWGTVEAEKIVFGAIPAEWRMWLVNSYRSRSGRV